MTGKHSESVDHKGVIGGVSDILELELTIDTSAYADGDLLADVQEITDAMRFKGGTGIIQTLTVIDKDKQAGAMDVYITDESGSWGTENATADPSDSEALGIQAKILVGAGDYYSLNSNSVANITDLGRIVKAPARSTSLYVAVVSRDTKTYSNADDLTLKFGILLD